MNLSGLGSETEGNKQLQAADKLTQPSVLSLRLKADWDAATPIYEKAANNFKQSKAFKKAVIAFEKAATGQQRLNSPWHAAKHLEKAGECCREAGDTAGAPAWYERAAECYEEAGRGQAAAEALSKGARAIEDSDPPAASRLYARAVKSLEAEGKAGMASDIHRQATANEVRREEWAAAAGFQLRWAVACEAAEATTSQCRAHVAAIIIWLYGQDAKNAYLCYQDALAVPAFTTSDEAFAADSLINAYRAGDAEAIKKLITPNSIFFNIDNQVARLARKLPTGDVRLMAAALEVAAAEQAPDGLQAEGSDGDPDFS